MSPEGDARPARLSHRHVVAHTAHMRDAFQGKHSHIFGADSKITAVYGLRRSVDRLFRAKHALDNRLQGPRGSAHRLYQMNLMARHEGFGRQIVQLSIQDIIQKSKRLVSAMLDAIFFIILCFLSCVKHESRHPWA